VVPHHREIAGGALPLFRWQLRSPFAHVVCTEDGSDPAAVLPKLLAPTTPWTVRLNGCDAASLSEQRRRDFRAATGLSALPVIAFLGRIEPYKGSLEFIDAVLDVLRAMPDCADVVLVGDGPLRAEMQARVAAAGQSQRVHFTGSQPRERVNCYVGAADIYVSTNMYGNLSNANLEALAAGACLVLPTSDPTLPLDTITDNLIPDSVAQRYDRNRLPDSLADTLMKLLRSPEEIAERRRNATVLAGRLLRPWPQVVGDDIALMKSIAQGQAAPVAARSAS
jgi:glycosyltransferase involved in cell wall biosynthesis